RSFVPTQVAAGRIAIGALVLVVLLVLRRQRVRVRRRVALDVLVVAVALSALPFMLIAEAQPRLTTVLAGMINATTPLFPAIFVVLLIPTERPDRGQLAGLLVGFLGISVLLGVWDAGSLDLVGALLMVGATTCYGFGTVWSRLRLSDSGLSPVALPAAQLSL